MRTESFAVAKLTFSLRSRRAAMMAKLPVMIECKPYFSCRRAAQSKEQWQERKKNNCEQSRVSRQSRDINLFTVL